MEMEREFGIESASVEKAAGDAQRKRPEKRDGGGRRQICNGRVAGAGRAGPKLLRIAHAAGNSAAEASPPVAGDTAGTTDARAGEADAALNSKGASGALAGSEASEAPVVIEA